MRCLHLTREIEALGGQCLFVLDHLPDSLKVFLEGQDIVCLYDEVQEQINPEKDARLFLKHSDGADWAVLDDYRIHQDWEDLVRDAQKELRLCVLDDLERPHNCDVLIDMGTRSAESRNSWDQRVPEGCIKLLGPRYAILSAPYQQDWRKTSKSTPLHHPAQPRRHRRHGDLCGYCRCSACDL